MKNFYLFCCLLYAPWTAEANIHVVGFVGGGVSFLCPYMFAQKNQKYFCRDPCRNNEDTLVTVESGQIAGGYRITLNDFDSGNLSVTFSGLVLSDTGKYWCAVERFGFDTFTAVNLTIKEAVDTTTIPLDVSSTSMYQHFSNSTPPISQVDTTLITASNQTDGEKYSIGVGPVLFSMVGVVAVLTLLLLVNFRKCMKTEEQQQVYSQIRKIKVDCERGDTGEEAQSSKKLSETPSPPPRPKQQRPTSASTAADGGVLHLYGNVDYTGDAQMDRWANNVLDERDTASRIYIRFLPPATPDEDSLGQDKDKR